MNEIMEWKIELLETALDTHPRCPRCCRRMEPMDDTLTRYRCRGGRCGVLMTAVQQAFDRKPVVLIVHRWTCPSCKMGFTHIATPYEGQLDYDDIFTTRSDLQKMSWSKVHQLMMDAE